MTETRFHDRRAVQIENQFIRLTVTIEGGHIAEILDKATGVNPLWIPPWRSIEPSSHDTERHPEYGANSEAKLLAGIMGHNLCLDLFGPPSEEEARAGITVHGEASVLPYEFRAEPAGLVTKCILAASQIAFERRLILRDRKVLITEKVENLSVFDRPIAWTQHATLGPPFVERGVTQFRAPAAPDISTTFTSASVSGGYTTHLLDAKQEHAWFFAYSPRSRVVFGYVWRRNDFPWLGIWEENHSRTQPPWNGRTITQGMEFGVSPVPETRREMIERQTLFDTPGYRWLPARTTLEVSYYAAIAQAAAIPEAVEEFEKIIS